MRSQTFTRSPVCGRNRTRLLGSHHKKTERAFLIVKSPSIRGRIASLVVIAALPALALSLYSGIAQRAQAQAYARADLQRYARLAAERLQTEGARQLRTAGTLPSSGMLTIVDHAGRILARHPEAESLRADEETLGAAVLEAMHAAEGGVFEATDSAGRARLYAMESVRTDARGQGTLNVLVSIPRKAAFADARKALFQTIAGIVIVTGLLLFCAWYGPEFAVLRRLRALVAMTSHIRAGDLTARTNFPPGDEEIGQLGHALDDMAQALQKRDADLKQALRELSEQVITDPLTRLNNRRYLWDFLGRDLIRARRAVLPVAAILFDIDHFKRFNDTWGHEAGDLVLKSVADVIRQNVRGSDIACRYGGEEFIIVLPEATRNVAVERAETIRRDIERMELVLGDKKLDRVTASFGVALYPTHADNAEALVRTADGALYQAKENGRNRVHVFEAAPSLL